MSVLTLEAHGKTARIHEVPGVVCRTWRRGRFYEQPLLDHIRAQGFSGLAVDVGANIGNHTLWLAIVCGLNVAAFEPLRFDDLGCNLDLNPGARVSIYPVALGARVTTARHMGKGKLEEGRGVLPMRTLDGYGLEGVSVIKLDVEDMEEKVLRGAVGTLRRDRPVVYAEARNERRRELIARVLVPLGYDLAGSFNSVEAPTPVEEWRPA